MTEKIAKPQLRFAGFDDTWEQRKLGEIVEFYNGDRSSRYPNDSDMVSEGVPFINAGDLISGRVKLDTANKITEEKFNELSGAKIQRGDIIYCLRGTLGKNAFVDNFDVGTVASSLVDIRPKKVVGKYLYQVLNSDIEYTQRTVNDEGAAQPNLSAKNLSLFNIPVPDEVEQEKIAAYFDDLDHLITLHQRKHDKLTNVKKSMLEKMFPKNGSNVPEIRFKGFTEAWEQRKLNEVSDVRDGTHDSPKYQSIGHPFVTSKNVKNGYITYDDIQYISDEDFAEINKRSKVDVNDILMGMIGTIGNMALIRTEPNFAIKNVALIKDTKQINYLYLYHLLQSPFVEKQLTSGMDGGTQKFVSLSNVRNLNVIYPSDIEQDKIGRYFEQLDHLITLHQRELEKLKNIKKACLEKMFV